MGDRPSLNLPYIIIAGVLLAGIVVIFLIYAPLYKEARGTMADIASKTAKLSERQSFLRTVDAKKAELATQAMREREVNVVLPVGDNLEDMLRVVDRAAQTSGITVSSIENSSAGLRVSVKAKKARGEANVEDSVVPLGFFTKISGSYEQIRNFIQEIQKSPRLVDITRLSFRKDEKLPGVINADVMMQFYSYRKLD